MELEAETVAKIISMLEGFAAYLRKEGNAHGAHMIERAIELIRAL